MAKSKIDVSVYKYNDNGSQESCIGTATYKGSGNPAAQADMVGMLPTGDVKVFPFYHGGMKIRRVLVANMLYQDGEQKPCTLKIYDPGQDAGTDPSSWRLVADLDTVTVNGVKALNISKVDYIEFGSGTLGLMDYNRSTVFTISINNLGQQNEKYTVTGNFYEFKPPSGPQGKTVEGHGVDLVRPINGSPNFCAVFSSGYDQYSPNGKYYNSTVVELSAGMEELRRVGPDYHDTEPGYREDWPVPNVLSMQYYEAGNRLLLTGLGGYQYSDGKWNKESSIQSIDLSNTGALAVQTHLIAAQDASASEDDQLDFRALAFSKDGSQAFVLTGKYNENWNMDYRLYNTGGIETILSFEKEMIGIMGSITRDVTPGYCWGLLPTEIEDKIWFAKGNEVTIVDGDGTPTANLLPVKFGLENGDINQVTLEYNDGAVAAMPMAPVPAAVLAKLRKQK